MKLHVGNFEFEHQLRPGRGRGLPDRLRRLNAELAPVLAIAAEEGDIVWTPEPIDDDFAAHLSAAGFPNIRFTGNKAEIPAGAELCPWGWTEEMVRWGTRNGWKCSSPEMAAVQNVNSRRFSFSLEQEWGTALDGACKIGSLDELAAAVSQLPKDISGWVVKAEFGMSARERILGRGGRISEQHMQWARRRLAEDGVLFFEPWVEKIDEAGLQFTVAKVGDPIFAGVTPLLTDAGGQYRGSRFAPDETLRSRWSAAIDFGLRAATRAQQRGYFGPLGIDAMRYRDSAGNERVRPLQDINARWTMGRVSLGLRRLPKPGEHGTWLHVRPPDEDLESPRRWHEEIARKLPKGVRIIRTSPYHVGGTSNSRSTVLLLALTSEGLIEAERIVLTKRN